MHPFDVNYDVIVVGGGPGGIMAAIAAARLKQNVLLLERYGFLGGMATTGLVNPFMPYKTGGIAVVRGFFAELQERLAAAGAMLPDLVHFDAELMKIVLDEWLTSEGVTVVLHSLVTDVTVRASQIESIVVSHKGGHSRVYGRQIIDATGDGDVAAMSGCKFDVGREEDGACQPMTLCFRVANVETDRIPPHAEINRRYSAARNRGEINNPRENVLFFWSVNPSVVHFNTTRVVGFSALDAFDLTQAEMLARQQVRQMVHFLTREIAGFEQAYLAKMAPQIGIRESRRLVGAYQLTSEDVLHARKFDDAVACSCYDIDIHNPSGTGTVIKRLPPGEWYHIPYRTLVPLEIQNCLIGCRCVSATHAAHSSLRIMPVVAAIGQAAGTAAALSCKMSIPPADVPVNILQDELRKMGAFITPDDQTNM